ncbi:MAG: hypothetical protein M3Y09_10225 [Actinomycetota bacterium]|nr:hypothetical protein [Actinomycetota bacterium]
MACHVRDLARRLDVPVGAVLEGGYDLEALATSAVVTIAALDGSGEAAWAAADPLVTPRAASYLAHHRTL